MEGEWRVKRMESDQEQEWIECAKREEKRPQRAEQQQLKWTRRMCL